MYGMIPKCINDNNNNNNVSILLKCHCFSDNSAIDVAKYQNVLDITDLSVENHFEPGLVQRVPDHYRSPHIPVCLLEATSASSGRASRTASAP